jgi:hypothetical protein
MDITRYLITNVAEPDAVLAAEVFLRSEVKLLYLLGGQQGDHQVDPDRLPGEDLILHPDAREKLTTSACRELTTS